MQLTDYITITAVLIPVGFIAYIVLKPYIDKFMKKSQTL